MSQETSRAYPGRCLKSEKRMTEKKRRKKNIEKESQKRQEKRTKIQELVKKNIAHANLRFRISFRSVI
jgi:hypothetical protein